MYRSPTDPTESLSSSGPMQRVTDVVCVTLYNEPMEELQRTLASLIRSAAVANQDGKLHSLCVCLVADGAEREDPEVSRWLDSLKPWYMDCETPLGQPWSVLPWPSERQWSGETNGGWTVSLLVHRKTRNQGKLHSHAVFFADVCPRLQPRRCWQIDVGTWVKAAAMGEMIDVFDDDVQVGAVGSRVELAMPEAGSSFAQRWQYLDFAMQAASLWPAEAATRHMSVVPGQFCAVRWEAMSSGGACAPVHQYLRGLQPTSRMDRIMFLAEDRVIGNELVLSEELPWRLAYGHQAEAVTDACVAFPELLRQRRRWHNSSFACRLWLLAAWPREMLRTDRDLLRKLSFSVAMLWQLLLATVQCLTPSMTLAGLILMGSTLYVHAQSGGAVHSWMTVMTMALAAWGALRPGSQANRWRSVGRDVCSTAALLLYGCVLYRLGGWNLTALVLGPMLGLVMFPVVVLPGQRVHMLRYVGEHWLLHSVCQMVLWLYAMRHLSDTSWGTKGLVGQCNGSARRSAATRGRYERAVLALSVVANAGVLYACTWTGVADLPAGAVVVAGSGVLLTVLLVAIAGHVKLGWSRARRMRHQRLTCRAIASGIEEQRA